MIDTTGNDATVIPANAPAVAGYVSGTNGVEWSDADWARFSTPIKVMYYQGYGAEPEIHKFNAVDIENRAVTPQQAADIVKQSVNAGIEWTTLYGTRSSLETTAALIRAMGDHIWIGHVDCILADWNLNRDEAAALVGQQAGGMTIRGVQWASPETNPDTLVPGTNRTLRDANCDLSVVWADWRPSHASTHVSPPPPPLKTYNGLLVVTDASGIFHARAVTSHDDVNWS